MSIAFNNQNNSIGIGSTNRVGFTTSITFNSTGVGIGTTNPTENLDVVGNLRIRSGIKDIYNNVGAAGSIFVSTGVGVSWTTPFAAGIQGVQGILGTQGTTGAQGTNGSNGTQGTTGAQGTNGSNGAQGTAGTQGTTGANGSNGAQGTTGTQGTNGSNGTQGATGTQGTTGANGSNGAQGATGTQGTTGANGSNGAQGTTGTQGTTGANGSNGAQGATGATGAAGSGGSITDDTTTNATRYPLFDDVTSGTVSGVFVSSSKLQFNPSTGTLSATIFTSLSDQTQKTNIRPVKNAVELVTKMNGVYYDWIDGDNKPSVGVIAQEIEKVLPEVVNDNANGLKSVSYGNIVGVLIEAIKEQQVRIEELEKKLNA